MRNFQDNFVQMILFAYLIRLLVVGASIGDALAFIGLASLYGFYYYLNYKKEPSVNEQFRADVVQLQEDLKNQHIQFSELKTQVNAMKLGAGFRGK